MADDQARAVKQIRAAKRRGHETSTSNVQVRRPRRFTLDQLSPKQIDQLVQRFRDGTPKTQLAADYGISRSSVQRLLRSRRTPGI